MKVRVASAGTGKTTSLVLRYLELIASGTPVRRIAGVTFTRAAADELRQRVGAGIAELLYNGHYLTHTLLPQDKAKFAPWFSRSLGILRQQWTWGWHNLAEPDWQRTFQEFWERLMAGC